MKQTKQKTPSKQKKQTENHKTNQNQQKTQQKPNYNSNKLKEGRFILDMKKQFFM